MFAFPFPSLHVAVSKRSRGVGAISLVAFLALIAPVSAQSWDFEYTFDTVYDANANDHVVEDFNVVTMAEGGSENITFLTAELEGILGYRTFLFDFAFPTEEVELTARVSCWNYGPGVGYGSIWGSVDGQNWILLLDAPTPPSIDAGYIFMDTLPPELTGSDSLWIEVRLMRLSGTYAPGSGVQFSRHGTGYITPRFALRANLMEDTYRLGDFQGDGTVDVSDAVALLAYLFTSGPASSCPAAGDLNDTGTLDVSDVILHLQNLFLTSTLPTFDSCVAVVGAASPCPAYVGCP